VSVADELQGRGLGSILVAHLADATGDAGISTFHAHVLSENHRMIEVFRRSGFPVHLQATPGAVDRGVPHRAH
jgi:ribosomal protein S18 acetylase RimI-like enzyme